MKTLEGTVERGDRLLIANGDVRILGIATARFQSASGYSSMVRLSVLEILSGEFPSGVEELTVNANSWQIFSIPDDATGTELKAASKSTTTSELIEALKIFGGSDRAPGGVFSDSGEISVAARAEDFSKSELDRLRTLGWIPIQGGFYSWT